MKLNSKTRGVINDALHTISSKRQRSIPLTDIQALLAPHGWKIEEAIFTGRQGTANVELIDGDGKECENSYLVLSWHKGDLDGQWEINAYLS